MRHISKAIIVMLVSMLALVASDNYMLERIAKEAALRPPVVKVFEKEIIKYVEKPDLDVAARFHMLKSSVRVSSGFSTGSGVVIYSGRSADVSDKKFYTYILTCSHVLHGVKKAKIERFDYIDNKLISSTTNYDSNVISDDMRLDLAILEVKSEIAFPEIATLASENDLNEMALGDPVYVCGCALGGEPFITSGTIASFNGFEGLYQSTAPVIFGNSGGGLFTKSGKLLGIIRLMLGSQAGPYPHAGLSVPAKTISGWLKERGFGFIQSPNEESSLDRFLNARRKALEDFEREQLQKMIEDFMKALKPNSVPSPKEPD